jgi:hypothetical protein
VNLDVQICIFNTLWKTCSLAVVWHTPLEAVLRDHNLLLKFTTAINITQHKSDGPLTGFPQRPLNYKDQPTDNLRQSNLRYRHLHASHYYCY